MAGYWIKFEQTTPDKPEVVRMATLLNIDQDEVVGKLLRVWIWADLNSIPAEKVCVTDAFIDRLVSKKRFAHAMRLVGWLTGDSGALNFPNFQRHNGESAKKRALENNRQVSRRQRDKNVTDVTPMKAQERDQRRGEEIYPPLPPAGGDESSVFSSERQRSPQRRLASARSELERVETELTDIVRPGGCSYNVPPVGAKAVRHAKLMELRKTLLKEVEAAQAALTEDASNVA